jgi:undecaprenyl phosphate-alpha-L-ara4FN deformylase
MTSTIELAIKVDVDTWVGAREGIPRLNRLLLSRGIKASFFLSLGPDNSGQAVWRALKRRGFIQKMIRTKAPSAYGFKTLFMGTILPAPIIAHGLENTIQRLMANGQEVGLHAYDHVLWHDRLWKMTPTDVRTELIRGMVAFTRLTGHKPQSFAAPAWRISGPALSFLQDAGLAYISTTRGTEPYLPCLDGRDYHILEIPTTLPTADEVLGDNGLVPNNLADYYLEMILKPGLHVLTIHAEMEGRGLIGVLERILSVCRAENVGFPRLIDIAVRLAGRMDSLKRCPVVRSELPGRPGRVSRQG